MLAMERYASDFHIRYCYCHCLAGQMDGWMDGWERADSTRLVFLQAASRSLREAASLAPDNAEVKSAFLKIRDTEETSHPLRTLCERYATDKDEEAGREATRFLRTEGLQPAADVALDCLNAILSVPAPKLSSAQDDVIGGLVRQSAAVRRHFAAELQNGVTKWFDEIYERGDGAAVCLDTVVLDTSLWQSEKVRMHCEAELFQLFIAKLMESGHDLDGRSLKGIARLLAVDAERLYPLFDEEGFDVILASLDLRLSADVRSQATLATAKYLEASKDEGQKLFTESITGRMKRNRNDDLVIAFSAAAAVFPIVPTVGSALFLTEGFVQSLTPLLDRRHRNSPIVRAVLELFNTASTDTACREAIAKYHSDWLSHVLSNGTDETSALAAVVLAKIRASENGKDQEKENGVTHDLIGWFKKSAANNRHEQQQQQGPKDENLGRLIEGLAYSSVKPDVKEQLAKDTTFLKGLFGVLQSHTADSSVLYGGLMIILSLTKYLPNMSEEQKKMSELKAYANASPQSSAPDALDTDDYVRNRCTSVIESGVMSLLVDCGKSALPSILSLCGKILLELSKNSKSRGQLAQQGAVKLLISIATKKDDANPQTKETIHHAAHSLARILISVNPSHVFPPSGFPQVTSAIRPLLQLLTPPDTSISSDQPRDLLPVFESLLALTNLASAPDNDAADTIVRLGWTEIEDLLLSHHAYIQRAACELTCNLMTCDKGIGKFADGSARAGQRLHIMLALADVEDLPTRRAAGGALAMLTEFEAAVMAILDRERGVEIILALCSDDDDAVLHRGVFCVSNMVQVDDPIGARARDAFTNNSGAETLKTSLRKSRNPAVLQTGVEAIKILIGDSSS